MQFLRLLAGLRSPVLSTLMLWISRLGTPFAAAAVISWIHLCVSKEAAYGIGFSACFSSLLAQSARIVFRRPRPWILDTGFIPEARAMADAAGGSLPGIHAVYSSVFCTAAVYYKKKQLITLSFLLTLLLLFARMYLGCETPLDLGAGCLTGIPCAVVILMSWDKNRHSLKNDSTFVFFLTAFSLVLLALTAALIRNAAIEASEGSDCFGAFGACAGFSAGFLLERVRIRFLVRGKLREKLLRFAVSAAGSAGIFLLTDAGSSVTPAVHLLRNALTGFWMTGLTPLICLKLGLCRRAA